jgi:hypothetical protein
VRSQGEASIFADKTVCVANEASAAKRDICGVQALDLAQVRAARSSQTR